MSYSAPNSSSGLSISIEENSGVFLRGRSAEETVLLADSLTDNARRSVWKISSPSFYGSGTAFSVGPDLFVTNFHVMLELLQNDPSVKKIVLEQEGGTSQLTIKRIVKVSALYDLVLFETEENVASYLDISEDLPHSEKELFIFGYPKGEFQKLKKTSKLVKDDHHYTFPVNITYLNGASGSPVLDEEGQLVGILSYADTNMVSAIKSDYLEGLVTGDMGLNCFEFINLAECIKEEVETLKTIAGQGHALAQYRLSDMYYTGRGVERDLNWAFFWVQESALQNYALAQYRLAEMYYTGQGTKQNFEMAADWFQKFALQGYASGQYNLAMMYYAGRGKERDPDLASIWLRRAVSQGYAEAQFILAMIHYQNEGPDFVLVFSLLQQSALQGHIEAQYNLAVMYYNGEGITQNFEMAFIWYKESAEGGYLPAQYHLGVMYHRGEGVERNLHLALVWIRRSAVQGYAPSQEVLERFKRIREQSDIN